VTRVEPAGRRAAAALTDSPAEGLREPQPVQDPHGVRAEREARAHFTQDACLLVAMHLEACLSKRDGCRQPADPGGGD
jgi:hypothetical protein